MKLSTKIIIGLVVFSALAAFLFPISLGALISASSDVLTDTFGPVKAVRISSGTTSIQNPDARHNSFVCEITAAADNTFRFWPSWPSTAKVTYSYSDTDSTLTIIGNITDGDAVVRLTLQPDILNRIVASGEHTRVDISDFTLPLLMLDLDGAVVEVDNSEVSLMFARECGNYDPADGYPTSRVFIENSSSVDSLFYSVGYERAIKTDGNVGAFVALPGSKARLEIDDDDTGDVITVAID